MRKILKRYLENKYIIPGLVVVLVIFSVVLFTRFFNSNDDVSSIADQTEVRVAVVEHKNSVSVPLVLTGRIQARQNTTIRSLVNGTVQSILPVGTRVQRGQGMFRLINEAIEQNYLTALTAQQNASASYSQSLFATNSAVNQARLAVDQAEIGLALAEQGLVDAKNSTELNFKSTVDSARVTFDSALNTLEQAMRFLSSENYQTYAFQGLLNSNQQLWNQAINYFQIAKADFLSLPSRPGEDIRASLVTVEGSLGSVKTLNNLSYSLLNYGIAGDSFTAAQISSALTTSALYQSQLNSLDTALKSARNALDNLESQNRIAIQNAEKQVEIARLQLQNAKTAFDFQTASTKQASLGSESQLAAARAQLAAAKFQYDNLALPSPFTGTVIAHSASAGSQVSPGQPILELGDVKLIEIRLEVSPEVAKVLSLGQAVKINELDAVGRISEIEPAASPTSGKIGITIEADNTNSLFTPGSIADIELELIYEIPDLIAIPLSLVKVGQNQNTVLVVEDGVVVERSVVLGRVFANHVEIEQGLNVGDLLIVQNGAFLQAGSQVDVYYEQ